VLETDGTVSVYTGSSSVGQGLETVFTQIAADALGMPMSVIRGVFHGSTTGVKEGYGSYSSRSIVMGGSAVVHTAKKLLDDIKGERFTPGGQATQDQWFGGPSKGTAELPAPDNDESKAGGASGRW
jgi:CO/xanthine dehydrogenase Mo-binding subunit